MKGLESEYRDLRDVINDCAGYRILEDDEFVLRGDETVCGSMLLGEYAEGWQSMEAEDWVFGKTVAELNADTSNDMDASERLFRRRVTS